MCGVFTDNGKLWSIHRESEKESWKLNLEK